ncbi:Beta-lactamase class C family protein [Lactiplantibacillus pentosus KCA1]|nr:serine hydrolase [Lactiplantibacillus pentosus]EIW14403.1 Beta-lactamase class C family protein [Lactiplantibacillus pentosus KCA1]
MKQKLLWLRLPAILVLIIVIFSGLIITQVRGNSVTKSNHSLKLSTSKTANLEEIPTLQTNFTVNNLSGKSAQVFNGIGRNVSNSRFYGAYLGSSDNKLKFSAFYGKSNVHAKSSFKMDTAFLMGNYQELLNNAMLLKLVDQGQLNLTTKLSNYFSKEPLLSHYTVSDLLSDNFTLYISTKNSAKLRTDKYIATPNMKLAEKQTKKNSQHMHVANSVIKAVLISMVTKTSYEKAFNILVTDNMNLSNTRLINNTSDIATNDVKGYNYYVSSGYPVQRNLASFDMILFGTNQLRMPLIDVAISYAKIFDNDYFSKKYNSIFHRSLKKFNLVNSSYKKNMYAFTSTEAGQKVTVQYDADKKNLIVVGENFPNKRLKTGILISQLTKVLN